MKKRLAVLFAVLTVLTSVVLPCGMNAAAANYFPTTPIEFENLNLALFSQLDLTTAPIILIRTIIGNIITAVLLRRSIPLPIRLPFLPVKR